MRGACFLTWQSTRSQEGTHWAQGRAVMPSCGTMHTLQVARTQLCTTGHFLGYKYFGHSWLQVARAWPVTAERGQGGHRVPPTHAPPSLSRQTLACRHQLEVKTVEAFLGKETLPACGSREHSSGSKPVVPGRRQWGWLREEGSVQTRNPELKVQTCSARAQHAV